MSFSMPIQWHHYHEDPLWPDGTFHVFVDVERKSFPRHYTMVQYLNLEKTPVLQISKSGDLNLLISVCL